MPIRRRDLLLGTAGAAVAIPAPTLAAEPKLAVYPPAGSDLFLPAPVSRWDEGLPLGNGLIGAVLYGEDRTLRLSLDRSDLWDLRQPHVEDSAPLRDQSYNWTNLQRLKLAQRERQVLNSFVKPFESALYPAKIPAGYLTIGLREGHAARAFHLDLARAEARVDIGDGQQRLTAFVSAAAQALPGMILLRIPGPLPDLQIAPPYSFAKRGYPEPSSGIDDRVFWMMQKGPDGSGVNYAIVASSRSVGSETQIIATIVCSSDLGARDDIVSLGRQRISAVLAAGYDAALRPHLEWWRRFWADTRLALPDDRVQSQCDRTRYFYGAASRPEAPPLASQGVWTEDTLTPAAQGNAYRHDLSLPASYLPYAPLGLAGLGDALCDRYTALLPTFESFARTFYSAEAASSPRASLIPANMSADGAAIGGWPATALSPTAGIWVALLVLRHARFGYGGSGSGNGGASFLAARAYPFAAAIGSGLVALLQPDAGGRPKLLLSSSPELEDDRLQAFVPPHSNWDLSLMRALLEALAIAAAQVGKPDDAARWRSVLSGLESLHRDGSGALLIGEDTPYIKSARHLGHAAAIYPFGLITTEGSAEDRQTIAATLADFKKVGTEFWQGESFAWYAAMLARCGLAERAMIGLDYFVRGFVSRNGFHIGGDQTGNGFSHWTNRTFSLQGNFLALEAVHEMLLQYWGGTVRIFPAITQNWPDVSFSGLRTENGLRVSATRKAGHTVGIALEATRDGAFHIRDPFGVGAAPHWSHPSVRRTGGDYSVTLKRGERLEGRRS